MPDNLSQCCPQGNQGGIPNHRSFARECHVLQYHEPAPMLELRGSIGRETHKRIPLVT
jgi:hypothetical protein